MGREDAGRDEDGTEERGRDRWRKSVVWMKFGVGWHPVRGASLGRTDPST